MNVEDLDEAVLRMEKHISLGEPVRKRNEEEEVNEKDLDEYVLWLIANKNLNYLVGSVVHTLATKPTSLKNLEICQDMLNREAERIHRAITNY